jgi:hypothetical protein
MYDSYFQTYATLLVSNGHVFLLFVFTNRQFNHSYVPGYLEKSPIAILKLTTPGLLYFNVTTWSYSLPVKLLNFPCNGNCRVVTIVSRTIELSDHQTVGPSKCRTKELSDHHYAPVYYT